MPKKYAKRLTLHPLSFEDAVKAIVSADLDRLGLIPKRRKRGAGERPEPPSQDSRKPSEKKQRNKNSKATGS